MKYEIYKRIEKMEYGPEYQGLETSDEILQAIEERFSGRTYDNRSQAYSIWADPGDHFDEILARAWEIVQEGGTECHELCWGLAKFIR